MKSMILYTFYEKKYSSCPQKLKNSKRVRLAVPKVAYRLGAPSNFDRCAVQALPVSSTGSGNA